MEGKEITLEIEGREVKAREGMTILEAARGAGINIPTLCHHPVLTSFGACRICSVEIVQRGRSRIVTSCVYPVEEGLVVKTKSDRVIRDRKMLIELMLAHAPKAEVIQELAREYGVEKTRFKIEDEENLCILCGLCTRICEERMGKSAINFVGRGIDRKVDTPFHIQTEDCMACGACAFVCPTGAIKLEDISKNKPIAILSEFDESLISRSPIYVPYPQGVPNVPVIDRDKCVHFLTGECGICQEVCQAGAINYEQEDEIVEIDAGSIILAPGFDEFDPTPFFNYGYKKYPNVVTSIEFERMLSASGPYQGELKRPSDRKPPQRIAWIQCIGSRDASCNREYCSSVCCTYAVKEAIVAKEHVPFELEETIFFMDMRTQGKDFDKFYERAKREEIEFVRGKVYGVEGVNGTGNLLLRYTGEEDKLSTREFDLVVLSVGFQPSPEAMKLAKRLGIQLNKYGFCHTDTFSPVETSRSGIFVTGAFQGPKDIPETVVQASGAGAKAASLLSPVRNTLISEKTYPPEKEVDGEEPRIGVFVCHCGINIGAVVDVPKVVEYARPLPNVVYAEYNLYTCSQDTQERIKAMIEEHNLNRVVVASCSPRTHEPLFQETIREAGLNRYLFEMTNIRDQCSWVHRDRPEEATQKAKDLIKMAIDKVRLVQPLKELTVPVIPKGLVIGGGVAGMTAAQELANQGFECFLIEKSDLLGGNVRQVYYALDGNSVSEFLEETIQKVEQNKLIHVYRNAQIREVTGYIGNFTTTIDIKGKEEILEHGVIIVATGGREYRPSEYLYGKHERVITQLELEEKLATGSLKPEGLNNVVMIQCVGSRTEERLYCSKVCCSQAVKNALKIREINPSSNICVLYKDMRTYGFKEEFYQKARNQGVIFLRYTDESKPEVSSGNGGIEVKIFDPVLGDDCLAKPDLLVLSAGIVPNEDNEALARMLKVPCNEDGFFLEAHVKLRPVDFATDGIFVCGLAHSPKPIEESISQALAAAGKAAIPLSKGFVTVEPIVSSVNEEKCVGCGLCESICAFSAIRLVSKNGVNKAETISASCKGCGLCAASCPQRAITMGHFTDEELTAQIGALVPV